MAQIEAAEPKRLSRDEQLAFWINGYNALAMYNVLHSGVLPENKIRFFWIRELAIDGRTISLYDLENDLGERVNLAERHPEIVEELQDLLARWQARCAADRAAAQPER